MSTPHFAGAAERIGIAAGTPLHETVTVQTRFEVQRWDAEQTGWLTRKFERDWGSLPSRPDFAFTPQHFGQYGVEPYSATREEDCNLIVQAGWVALLGGVAGTTITNKFSATNARIGVGTSSTAAAFSQTALQGDSGGSSTTSYYQLVSGSPVISTSSAPATLVFSASFGTGVANFSWNEFGTDNYTASGVTATGLGAGVIFFNRGVSAQGTKASGQTWTATETISFGYPSGSGTVS
jgi:hypothetical protein